ncbi:MAG: cysteine desulfurase [Coleofasciculaceae cyanobacterium SM2_1_6]|nr:cysteine desulfurase [Coleofasciculaceae cyanobacterium SM2_1_6]
MQIYLDHSATTPTRPEAIDLLQQVMTTYWGNPSSLHEWGQRAATVLETARMQVAGLIRAADPESIVFTSGGTEANNLAIFGVAHQYTTPQHLIISQVEHSAISQPASWLESRGWQVTRLGVDRLGQVDPTELERAIQPNTVLISIIYGQSEVGTLQPIEKLWAIAQRHGIPFHTDAVQVAGRYPLDVQKIPVDFLSLSSHKLYGPQGTGALYIKEPKVIASPLHNALLSNSSNPGLSLVPLLSGGGQEHQLRSGTQAVPIIAGFGLAAELAAEELPTEMHRLQGLRDRLFAQLADLPQLVTTGHLQERLPHHVSFVFLSDRLEITGKTLVRHLNLAGIGISSGSACHSGKTIPSPILLAMGYTAQESLGGIRLTLGKQTTAADIDWTAIVLRQVIDRLSPKLVLSGSGATK